MYLLWVGLCIISAVIIYFFIPETAKLPGEEIGALFGDEVVVHLTIDVHGSVEDMVLSSFQLEQLHIKGSYDGVESKLLLSMYKAAKFKFSL
jgi:hypothetical protein